MNVSPFQLIFENISMYSRPAYNKYLIIATVQRQIINTAITANGMDIEFMRSTTKKNYSIIKLVPHLVLGWIY